MGKGFQVQGVGLTRQVEPCRFVDISRDAQALRQFSGNSKVCVESYPQVYPQAVYNYYHFPPSYPQGREIVLSSANPHLILSILSGKPSSVVTGE